MMEGLLGIKFGTKPPLVVEVLIGAFIKQYDASGAR